MLYKTMLGREADTPGVTDWVLKIRETGSRETAFNGFLQSAEFKNLCADAGINVGNPIADNHTTGRASTGEKVTVYEAFYLRGELQSDYPSHPIEGTLIDLKDYVHLAPGDTIESEPFIAYEGAVGYAYIDSQR